MTRCTSYAMMLHAELHSECDEEVAGIDCSIDLSGHQKLALEEAFGSARVECRYEVQEVESGCGVRL